MEYGFIEYVIALLELKSDIYSREEIEDILKLLKDERVVARLRNIFDVKGEIEMLAKIQGEIEDGM